MIVNVITKTKTNSIRKISHAKINQRDNIVKNLRMTSILKDVQKPRPNISVISIKVNRPKSPIKRKRFSDWVTKENILCCMKETHEIKLFSHFRWAKNKVFTDTSVKSSTKKGIQAKKTSVGKRQVHYHVKFAVYN